MTYEISTVGPSKDYATLAAWWAAKGGSSVAQWAECYSGSNLGSVVLSGSGWTDDAENFVKVYSAEGNHHNGDKTSGAYISSASTGIDLRLDYGVIDGIRITSSSIGIDIGASTATQLLVQNCLVHDCGNIGINASRLLASDSPTYYILNNLVIDCTNNNIIVGGDTMDGGIVTAYLYNNTSWKDSNGSGIYITNTSFFGSGGGNVVSYNNISMGASVIEL